MTIAYVDTSCMVAIAFDEPGAAGVRSRMRETKILLASNLLEAEYRAAMARENVQFDADALTWLRWILPDRPLDPEMIRVLDAGYVRGADLWHLAAALYVAAVPAELTFLTLDERQADVAASLGFAS